MALHYRTSGFIIKKKDVSEADRIFTIFTKDFGKIKVSGKAIRKISSKLRGGIDMVSLSEIEFIQGKNHKTLTDSVVLENFKGIKDNLVKLRIAYKIAEVLNNLIKGEEKDERIWELLNETFEKLNNQPLVVGYWPLIYYYFLWNFFSILGYQPELYKCVACQKKLIPGFLYFSSGDGGIVCNRCTKTRKRINTDTVKILRLILKDEQNLLFKLKIPPFSKKLLTDISKDYYKHLLLIHLSEKDLKKNGIKSNN